MYWNNLVSSSVNLSYMTSNTNRKSMELSSLSSHINLVQLTLVTEIIMYYAMNSSNRKCLEISHMSGHRLFSCN